MAEKNGHLNSVSRLSGLGTSAARLHPAGVDELPAAPVQEAKTKLPESALCLSGLGTSAARLGAPEAARPATPKAPAGMDGVVVWSEPRVNRMDVSQLAAALPREGAGRAAAPAGRPRLLYPEHWQSPYPHGNRYAALFERETLAWLTRFNLIVTPEDLQTIKEFECGLYGGLSSPTSNLRDGLLITEFVSLWLFFDDRVIEDSTVFDLDDPVGIRDDGEVAGSSNGFVNAWNDLCTRLRQTQSEAFMQRLGTALKAWIGNAQIETKNAKAYQATGVLPSFDTMLHIRTISIGMYPTFYLIEMAEGFELPDEVRAHATVVELKRMASRLVGYGNDIGGLAKDLAGNWPNLVVAYKDEHGTSLSDAFEKVVHMHNRDVEVFDSLEQQLPSWGPDLDPKVKEWIQAVRYSVLGFTFWESLAMRYQKWKASAEGKALTSPVTVFNPAGTSGSREPIVEAIRTVQTTP